MVFNPNSAAANVTMRVPLYYSGLSTVRDDQMRSRFADLSAIDAGFLYQPSTQTASVAREGGTSQSFTLSRDWAIDLPISMAPNSFTWFVFE